MDIYSYINSKDVAVHCREIDKTWTPYEMAIIISRSNRTMDEKHAAWRELITDYPDMPTPKSLHYKSYDSLHVKLLEAIGCEEYSANIESDMSKLAKWLRSCYVDIPTPFKRGDILKIGNNTVFVLNSLARDDDEFLEEALRGERADGSDLTGWGYFTDDKGLVYGDHVGGHDCFEYYHGKLAEKDCMLHYLNLFFNDEIGVAALLTTQCRAVLKSYLSNDDFSIRSHGCSIPVEHLFENRLTHDEKEEIEQSNGVMPWVAGKLSKHQVEFLVKEMDESAETVQLILGDSGGWCLGTCAGIVHEENHYERTQDSRFNYERRAMARMILEAYDCTESGWYDIHTKTYT